MQTQEEKTKRWRTRKKEISKWMDDYIATLKCEQCGFSHPAAIKFHHMDPSQKDRGVTKAAKRYSWSKERILREISKCKVLCGNCHDILHWNERHNPILPPEF